jgi:hypothetical protein
MTQHQGGGAHGADQPKPGRPKDGIDSQLLAAQAEVARLREVAKERAVKLVALRTKSRSADAAVG